MNHNARSTFRRDLLIPHRHRYHFSLSLGRHLTIIHDEQTRSMHVLQEIEGELSAPIFCIVSVAGSKFAPISRFAG